MSELFFAWSNNKVYDGQAKHVPNTRIGFDELVGILQGFAPAEYLDLPELAAKAYSENTKEAAGALSHAKSQLPYFLASGFCLIHHNNANLEYNGVLQIDIDFKHEGGNASAIVVLNLIKELAPPGIILAGLSPSTYGVKILLKTDNTDKTMHGVALNAGISYLSELLSISESNFDKLGASQPVYAFYERPGFPLYVCADADTLHFDPNYQTKELPAETINFSSLAQQDECAASAAGYIITNRINVATCYHEYLKVMAACKNAFGESGRVIANNILENSPQYAVSNFRKWAERKWNSIGRSWGAAAGAATIVWLASKNGFKYKPEKKTILTAAPTLVPAASEHNELPVYHEPVKDYRFDLDLKKAPPSKVEAMTNIEFDAYVKEITSQAFVGAQEPYTFWVESRQGYGTKEIGVGFPGALIPVFGAQKSRKTSLIASIMGAALSDNHKNDPFVFKPGGPIFWYDTEQAPFWFMQTIGRILKTANKTTEDVKDLLFPARIKHLYFTDRIRFIDRMVKLYDPAVIVIDGIKDLGKDYNSLEEATFMGEVLASWQERGCMIFPVLHLTKGDKTPRGHLGNTMLDKCDASLSVEPVSDDSIEVKHYNSRGAKFDPFIMYADSNNVLTTGNAPKKVSADNLDMPFYAAYSTETPDSDFVPF